MLKTSRILIIDDNDVIGAAMFNKLLNLNYTNLIDSYNLQIHDENEVKNFIIKNKPEYVIITRLSRRIEDYIIKHSIASGTKKIINYIKKCEYKPRLENMDKYITSILIDEVYGDFDEYSLDKCNILPELLRRIHDAKQHNLPHIYIEHYNKQLNFIHSDDLVTATLHIINNYDNNCIIDLKAGDNISIKYLSDLIKNNIDYGGNLIFLDSYHHQYHETYNRPIKQLNWTCKISLCKGIKEVYNNLIDQNKYFYVTNLFYI